MSEQRTQVGIAPFADAEEFLFFSSGVLSGNKPQPTGQLPAVGKALGITDRGDQSTRSDRTNAGDICQTPTGFSVPSLDPGFTLIRLSAQFFEVDRQSLNELAHHVWQPVLTLLQNVGDPLRGIRREIPTVRAPTTVI